jgi:sulfoxide reductase catalytic subunit YedY
MLIKTQRDIPSSLITPKDVYLSRRRLLTAGGVVATFAGNVLAPRSAQAASAFDRLQKSPLSTTDEKITPKEGTTQYNNFYEFGTSKSDPAKNAHKLRTENWKVSVEGECAKPKVYDMDSLLKVAPMEERVYRFRCVEAWSAVIPWAGYPLGALLKAAEPNAKAKYVAFETHYDSKTMLAPMFAGVDFPYREGLRMDEAMHPLTLLAFGMYGETLPNQNGAPIRLVVPWKYGFKSIKSIVKIRFVEKEPPITWKLSNAREYGFYSNVNPEVDHPRWSQASERRLGEILKRKTLMFNGYPQVASLYQGMDLKRFY